MSGAAGAAPAIARSASGPGSGRSPASILAGLPATALFDGLLMACAIVPHLVRLPAWCTPVALAALVVALLARHRLVRGHRLLTGLLALGAAALAWQGFGGRVTGDGTIAFLIWALLLKLGETRSARDRLFNVFGALMLAAWLPLYYESLAGIGLVAAASVLFFLALYAGNLPAATARRVLRDGGRRWLAALPFAAVLFAFFPRVPGPLWDIGLAMGLPVRQQVDRGPGGVGVEERLAPESGQRPGGGNPTVLIAEFQDFVPTTSRLYWRGPVLWRFDGVAWTTEEEGAGRGAMMRDAYRTGERLGAALGHKDQLVRYAVRIMPNGKHWRYGLDLPAANPAEGFISRDFQLLSVRQVRRETRFEGAAWLEYRGGAAPDEAQRALGLQLPENSDARLIGLGREIAAQGGTADETARQVAARFAGAGLQVAPANPVLPGPNALDSLFFDTRTAHPMQVAAAFAVAMRAAGIPTRLVAGFRGGRVMALTNFVVVKQGDAHVWAEAWLPQSGWTRFDPVDLVSPAAGQAVPVARPPQASPQPAARTVAPGTPVLERPAAAEPAVPLGAWLDGLLGEFDKWVVHFDAARQADILGRLGASQVGWLGVLGAAAAGLSLLGLAAWGLGA